MTPSRLGIAPPNGALPTSLTLGGVALQVSSLARSLPFYRDVLGLSVLRADATSAALGAPDSLEPLVTLQERPGVRAVAPRSRLGLFHIAILLPDRAALGRFVMHLAAKGIRAGAADHLVSEALYLSDPDGLGIEVYADRPPADWVGDGQELRMGTDPLDLRALAAAGRQEPWRGVPAGTVIGHVHLHVGDLDLASAFYHEALGFDKMVWSYPGAVFVAAGGYHHHLGLNVWAAGAPAPDAHDAQLLHWEIRLSAQAEIDAVCARLERHYGSDSPQRCERTAEGAVVRDPWGTTVRLRVP